MQKYGGSWAKGFASTFNPIAGINLGLQWKQQKAAQKKIDDELEQLKINSMELVIGLGNPGEKYKNNRHNVGHMVIEALLKENLPKGVIVRKTDVFMNESGKSVKKLVNQYKIEMADLWIIHDDIDLYYAAQYDKATCLLLQKKQGGF